MKEELLLEIKTIKDSLRVIPELRSKVQLLEQENSTLRDELNQISLQTNLQDQHMKAKNLMLYGIPGVSREERINTETTVNKVFKKLGIAQKVKMAHRLRVEENAPIVVEPSCKPTAQEVFQYIRRTPDTSLNFLDLHGEGKVEVRYHLSKHLNDLLRSASLIKKEANWMYCHALTSEQAVEMVRTKATNSEQVKIHTMKELMDFRDQLLKEGFITPSSPAAKIQENLRTLRKRLRDEKAKESEDRKKAKKTGV